MRFGRLADGLGPGLRIFICGFFATAKCAELATHRGDAAAVCAVAIAQFLQHVGRVVSHVSISAADMFSHPNPFHNYHGIDGDLRFSLPFVALAFWANLCYRVSVKRLVRSAHSYFSLLVLQVQFAPLLGQWCYVAPRPLVCSVPGVAYGAPQVQTLSWAQCCCPTEVSGCT